MTSIVRRGWLAFVLALAWTVGPAVALAQQNLAANPGFETIAPDGFFAAWGQGSPAKVGKVWFVDHDTPSGKSCLRMTGVPGTWTTCAGKPIVVEPNRNYWLSWRFQAKQPFTSRAYLFVQTNLGQRVFRLTDEYGDFPWTQKVVRYRTRPGETSLQPVLAIQGGEDSPGTVWWDDVGVWDRLSPELTALYRQEHPWDDVHVVTARSLGQAAGCQLWGDRIETRIGPKTSLPAGAGTATKIHLTAPGRGHDVYQLVVTPESPLAPLWLEFSTIQGPGKLPPGCLKYRVVRCVPVQETRDKRFPHGLTPDPLVVPFKPEQVRPGENVVFWIEWAPPPNTAAGDYTAQVTVRSGKKSLAGIPLALHRWAFDLPPMPLYRSLVTVTPSFLQRFYPERSEEDVLRLAWTLLSEHRLSGFNMALCPELSLKDGKLDIDWTRFDSMIRLARQFRATAISVGPMFGGGSSQGWKPHKFVGLVPLADKSFDALYVQYNRCLADRLRQYGMFDISYVYPYDEPEPDYMAKIARLFDLIRQAELFLKGMTTVDPKVAWQLWGKTAAWCVPASCLRPEVIERRIAAGDEIWVYNMTASIEDTPLEHRLFMWMAFGADARGGLLWNSCWWNQINPWENPTAAPVPVGRKGEKLYHYQAGQASLFYPDPAGKGPLIPSLRLVLIRQGVEDFDILSQLAAIWKNLAAKLSEQARKADVATVARRALVAPVMLDMLTPTTCPARMEAVRQLAAAELEVAAKRPVVIAYPARTAEGRLCVTGYAEEGTVLKLSGRGVTLDSDGRFEIPLSVEELARGLQWSAENGDERKTWNWPGLK